MSKNENDIELKRGYIAEACRVTGYSRTVYDRAKKKVQKGQKYKLTKGELEVWVKYKELTSQAKEQIKSLQ